MARDFGRSIRWEWSGSGFGVAEMTIKSRKRDARADDAQIDGPAASLAEIILRRVHQFAAKATALARRIDTEQSQITASSADFDVDTSGKPGGVFRKQKLSFFHVGPDAIWIDAVAFDKGLLDKEGRVDEPRERFHIMTLGKANSQVVRAQAGIRWSRHAPILSNRTKNSLLSQSGGLREGGKLSACSARTDANFFVNRGTHHCQDLIGNIGHVMDRGDVISDLGQDFLFRFAARLELAPGNQIIAIKDLRHGKYPQILEDFEQRAGAQEKPSGTR